MNNLAEHNNSTSPITGDVRKARADMLRAIIAAIPPEEREAALADIRDLLPDSVFVRRPSPQKSGDVLNNVFELFRRDPKAIRAAPEIHAELSNAGVDAPVQSVRNALNYLAGRSLLRRIGYGKYQLEDGRIIEGLP